MGISIRGETWGNARENYQGKCEIELIKLPLVIVPKFDLSEKDQCAEFSQLHNLDPLGHGTGLAIFSSSLLVMNDWIPSTYHII